MQHRELREIVCDANRAIARAELAILTWGNASGVDRAAGVMAIKPSGVEYDALRPEDIVVLSLETGAVVEGTLRPSSDTPTHLELYRAFPKIGGAVHTHSPHATAWCQAGREIPCLGTTHADTFHGPVPLARGLTAAEVNEAYERHTGLVIVEHFRLAKLDPAACPGVLVAGHAPFTWGKSPAQAVEHGRILEEVARMAWMTLALNPAAGPLPAHVQNKHYERKHGANAYYGQKK